MKKELYFSLLPVISLGLFFFGLGYLVKILPQKHPVYITYSRRVWIVARQLVDEPGKEASLSALRTIFSDDIKN